MATIRLASIEEHNLAAKCLREERLKVLRKVQEAVERRMLRNVSRRDAMSDGGTLYGWTKQRYDDAAAENRNTWDVLNAMIEKESEG